MAHYLVRVRTTEEIDGKMRSRTEAFLVNADTIEESQQRIHDYFKGTMVDYEIRNAGKTGIVGYIDRTGQSSE
jgi:hypothetical protein